MRSSETPCSFAILNHRRDLERQQISLHQPFALALGWWMIRDHRHGRLPLLLPGKNHAAVRELALGGAYGARTKEAHFIGAVAVLIKRVSLRRQ